jgi:hypothetical protein
MRIKILLVLTLIILVSNVTAIGVRPAKQEMDFEPGLSTSISFTVRNTKDTPISIIVEVDDEAINYMSPIKQEFDLTAGEYKDVNFELNLPSSMDPGINKLFFKVKENPPDDAGFVVSAAVRSFIAVKVPYPGEYLQATITAPNVKIGDPVPITINIVNDGTETVEVSQGTLNILGNSVTDAIPVTFDNIVSKSSVSKIIDWNTADKTVGEYTAIVNINFEGGTTSAETRFRVGDVLINILDVVSEEVSQGRRARVDIIAESKWNEPIADVYAELTLYDQIIKTKTEIMPEWNTETFTGYVETTDLEIGTHTGEVTLFYADKTVTSDFTLTIKKPINMYMIIGVVVAICAVVFAIILYVMKKKYSQNQLPSRNY